MSLTCGPDCTPEMLPVPLASCADGALDAFRALAGVGILPGIQGSQLLAERAAITGSGTNGRGSFRGQCRLLKTRDGVIGLNLARREDWELVPAWLGEEAVHDWQSVADLVRDNTREYLVRQGRLLGLAAVDATRFPTECSRWMKVHQHKLTVSSRAGAPRVLDLSSLWAGPLCSHLWQAAGADVIKVEGSRRPDGSRSGSREFFALLNGGKNNITLDLHQSAGQLELLDMISKADIVLEASRPRALRQMGIIAEDVIKENPGLSWISITGYGRREPEANWIAYGDDAGIAAGLSAILHDVTDEWLICGDAIADPLTGLHAALAGWASWLAGGGQLIELSLEQTVRHCITATAPPGNDYRARQARWKKHLQQHAIVPLPPQRRCGGPASTLC